MSYNRGQRRGSSVTLGECVLVPIEVGPHVGASLAACRANEPGLKIGQPHVIRPSVAADRYVVADATKISDSPQIRPPFCCPLWPDIPLENPRGRLSQGGSHHGIHQLHSDQHASARIEPAPVTGNDLASVEGRHTETHNHRSACARTGLAASRRSSLVVQKIYRGGSGLAIIDRAQVCAVPNACLSDRG
jgi:hypothetical protein